MRPLILVFSACIILYSCEKINPGDEIKSENEIELNNVHKITITKDNGLLIAGDFEGQITFIKTDANFNSIWRKDNFDWGTIISGSYGGPSSYLVRIINMFQNELGNYICFASVWQGGCVITTSVLIFELNQGGKQLKKKEIQGLDLNNVIKTNDGGYILSGFNIVKLDKELNKTWEISLIEGRHLWPGKIINTHDGRYALTSWDGDKSFFKILDDNGEENLSTEYSFNEIPFNETGNDLIQLKDNGYIIVGRTRSLNEPYPMDCGAMRINSSGSKVWSKIFRSDSNSWFEDIIYSSGDEFFIQGKVGYPSDPIQKSTLYKMNQDGLVIDSCSLDFIEPLQYHSRGYFVKTQKLDDNYFRFSKIPVSAVFE